MTMTTTAFATATATTTALITALATVTATATKTAEAKALATEKSVTTRTVGLAPPPSEHLRLFWREKKHQVFFPVTTDQNIARVNLFCKPNVSFYLMAIVAIIAIHQECIIPVALFNWSVVTY
jgi:hypothetical protein